MSWFGEDGLMRNICARCRRVNVGADCLGPCRCEVHTAQPREEDRELANRPPEEWPPLERSAVRVGHTCMVSAAACENRPS